ncbi:hypothetical protein [Amycolatopsis saalfeldensis]|uniref:Uncharacterized protein n=1 Tax=Amycolatopsis saalfeldensis TaxID=394193 RepID=A0A1H8UXT0_9PSEU|nr:hypothetical protein [Amycolatopsis saalfeldensis]SEP07985.1 hypothetical protein SAMN04489732_103529 [Amycolatopsis saalfeldensis]
MTGPLPSLPLFALGLLDDAAVFPPGLAPLPDAVAAHRRHEAAWYGALVGPLVIAGSALGELAEVLRADAGAGSTLRLALTFPGGPARVAEALEASAELPVSLEALEIAVPDGMEPGELLAALATALPKAVTPEAVRPEVFVEIPRDARRDPLLAALAGTRYRAKFRTGGVRAELYPDEAELAAAVLAAVEAGVPFKATAGLHHALRNTDPDTGFEQHGFLNLLLAADAAARGTKEDAADGARGITATQAAADGARGIAGTQAAADGARGITATQAAAERSGAVEAIVRGLLAERDGAVVAAGVREMGPERTAAARARFISFGTCSVTDPLTELAGFGLLTEPGGAA